MDVTTAMSLAKAGAFSALGLAAIGSALGCGIGGSAAVGAWKKCYSQGKPAPFLLTAFAGAPLSQTIYGMVMMNGIIKQLEGNPATASFWALFLIVGIFAGAAMGMSAYYQGKAAAGACDSYAETGMGFANCIVALGIIETVAIFTMVFGIQVTSDVIPAVTTAVAAI